LLLDVEETGLRVGSSQCEKIALFTGVAAKNRLRDVRDHANDGASLPVENTHLVLACAAAEEQVLPRIKASSIQERSHLILQLVLLLY